MLQDALLLLSRDLLAQPGVLLDIYLSKANLKDPDLLDLALCVTGTNLGCACRAVPNVSSDSATWAVTLR